MNPTPRLDYPLPEAMADVQGGCDVSLTRGVVITRDRHEVEATGGRIDEIGLGLVTDGRFAAEATVVDLGSGRARSLDLSGELVVLDWAYEPTVNHVRALLGAGAAESVVARYCFDLAVRVLRRAGFGPLTRPVLLRIGFRDICRDLDLHEGTAIRLSRGGRIYRIHLDYDVAALVVRTAGTTPDPSLEAALGETFPTADVHRRETGGPTRSVEYRVRFSLPDGPGGLKALLATLRTGLGALLARFEPERHRTTTDLLRTFGARDTLGTLLPSTREPLVPALSRRTSGALRVH